MRDKPDIAGISEGVVAKPPETTRSIRSRLARSIVARSRSNRAMATQFVVEFSLANDLGTDNTRRIDQDARHSAQPAQAKSTAIAAARPRMTVA